MDSKKYIIVFEGPDFSGKTTLANALSKKLNIPIYRKENKGIFKTEEELHKNIDQRAKEDYFQALDDSQNFKTSIIMDRFMISNIAYPLFYNRKCDLSYIQKDHWKNLILIYVATLDEKVLKERFNRGDILDINIEKIRGLHEAYQKAFIIFGHEYLKLDGSIIISNNIKRIQLYLL